MYWTLMLYKEPGQQTTASFLIFRPPTSTGPPAKREFHSTVQPSLSAPFSKLTKACGESDTLSLLLPGQIRLESRLRLCSSAFASVLSFTSNLNLLRLIINMHKNRVSDDHGLHT